MIRRALFAATFIALLVQATSAFADSSHFKKYEKRSLPKISPPDVTVKVLSNGIRCFLLEDHTLPMVKMRAVIRTGSIYDPPELVGLATLTGKLMRSGGAGELAPAKFDEALDYLGAELTAGISREMGSATLTVLAKDVEAGAALFFDMIFEPQFDKSRLAIAKSKIEEGLRRQNDDPSSLAAWKFRQLVYGAHSPWARRPSSGTLKRIKESDIRAFHKNYFKTNNMLLAIAGNFKTKKLVGLLERLLKDAPQGKAKFPAVAKVKYEFSTATEDVKRRISQAFIRMGHLGIKRHNPDKYALIIATDILGAGNFKSRLMEDIRTKRGLAYSVWSDISMSSDYGLFTVGMATRASKAQKAMGLIKGHIERIRKPGDVGQAELDFAKQSVLSRLIFEFDSAFKIVYQRARFHYYDYPPDYWITYRDSIARVTASDVTRVAKEYLHPDGLKTVVVGP